MKRREQTAAQYRDGRLQIAGKGFGFVILDDPNENDIYVPRTAMQDAIHGDRVRVRLSAGKLSPGQKQDGEIIKVLERAHGQIVGTYKLLRGKAAVHPQDAKINLTLAIPAKHNMNARAGDQVIAEILRWPQNSQPAKGKIIEILGQQGEPGVDMLMIIAQHQLATDFPAAVKEKAEQIPLAIAPAEIANRRDLREESIVTIDGEDAKDLDDAVHVESLGNGRYRLGVHIADVSHYVRDADPLDLEARKRGTSIYLVDRVIPMLPPRLSNGICSLNQGEDRLALSAIMDIDDHGQIFRYELIPSIIRVRTRLSYSVVRRILADQDEKLRLQYRPLVAQLETMEKLAEILRQKRVRRGAIDFDLPELKVILNDNGQPVAIDKRLRTVAESIIEEFMLAANETVAEHMSRLSVPFVYRVHTDPDPEKMLKLAELLRNFGQRTGSWTQVRPMDLQKALAGISGRPEEKMISTLMLRSLKQARYEAENAGHFGLAAEYYTHFTSPIRRYPDLIVHRLLRETLVGPLSAKRRTYWQQLLPKIAADSSDREREAVQAERESVDMKVAEYMEQFVGEDFPAVISGVTAFGFFVELENGVEGLVHVSALDDDHYLYQEEQHCLLGSRLKKRYRIGDPVNVRLARASAVERTVDFVLSDSARTASRKRSLQKGTNKEVNSLVGKKARNKGRRRKS